MIITAGRQEEQLCWPEPWTRFSARTGPRRYPSEIEMDTAKSRTIDLGLGTAGVPYLSGHYRAMSRVELDNLDPYGQFAAIALCPSRHDHVPGFLLARSAARRVLGRQPVPGREPRAARSGPAIQALDALPAVGLKSTIFSRSERAGMAILTGVEEGRHISDVLDERPLRNASWWNGHSMLYKCRTASLRCPHQHRPESRYGADH